MPSPPAPSFLNQVQVYCMQNIVLNDKPLMTLNAIFIGYQKYLEKKEKEPYKNLKEHIP